MAIALALAMGVTSAYAEDEEDLPLDTKIFRQIMKDIGMRKDGEGIEYRERAPLVVPPSRTLPPPQSAAPVAKNPAWPNDPDVKRRKDTTTAAEKARLKASSVDSVTEDSRPLRPDELGNARGPTQNGPAAQNVEDATRPMSPAQLGTKKNIFEKMFSAIGPEKPESAPFTGEPARTTLTAPPIGYQTPSPAQPYGVGPPKDTRKAMTLEERTAGDIR